MPAPAYHFSHHKLRELVYEEMSLVRRRLLHRRVAQALSARAGGEGLAGEIALHYQQGGVESEAAVYYRRAGDEARALFAHQEALHYYQLALALGHAETAELHEACGDLHTRRGEYQAALTSYEQAAAQTPLPHLEHKIGQVYYRRGDWELAESYFARAEAGWPAGNAPSPHLAYLYIDWSYTAYRRGDLAQAIRLANQAHSLAQEPKALAQTHNMLGVLARHQGEVSAARHHFIHSQQLAEEHGFWDMQITVLNNLALLETAGHNPQAAQQLLHTALQLCLSYGDRHWEAALRNNLADALHHSGAEEEAMAQLKEAVTIYAEIGRETGEWQPEIWKLMEW
jgi:tetratricopeptide (TPR) repeat protein